MTAVRLGLLIALAIVWIWVQSTHVHDPDVAGRLAFVTIPICMAILTTVVIDVLRRYRRKP